MCLVYLQPVFYYGTWYYSTVIVLCDYFFTVRVVNLLINFISLVCIILKCVVWPDIHITTCRCDFVQIFKNPLLFIGVNVPSNDQFMLEIAMNINTLKSVLFSFFQDPWLFSEISTEVSFFSGCYLLPIKCRGRLYLQSCYCSGGEYCLLK